MYYNKNTFYAPQGGLLDDLKQIGSGIGAGLTAIAQYGQPATGTAVTIPGMSPGTPGFVTPPAPKSGLQQALPYLVIGGAVLGLVYFTTRKR